jgi:hypothetical protein
VTWRRSARSSGYGLEVLDGVATSMEAVLPLASLRRAAMASINFREELRYSIVVHLWEKIASTFGCHVKEAPKRINKIAGAMVLLRGGRSEAHL